MTMAEFRQMYGIRALGGITTMKLNPDSTRTCMCGASHKAVVIVDGEPTALCYGCRELSEQAL